MDSATSLSTRALTVAGLDANASGASGVGSKLSDLGASSGANAGVSLGIGEAPIRACPHCGASMFSDVEVCYSCMHSVSLGRADGGRADCRSEGESGCDCSRDGSAHSDGKASGDEWVQAAANRLTTGSADGELGASDGGAAEADDLRLGQKARQGRLFDLFLVELSRFLSEFVADKVVGVEKLDSIVGENASMCSIADEQLDPESIFGVSDDAPSLAVGHSHALCGSVEGSELSDSVAEVGDALSEDRV